MFQTDRPFGGATSIQGAQDFLAAAEDRAKVWDQWELFNAVAQNILNDEGIADKRPAMAQAIRDFEKLLGAKSRSRTKHFRKGGAPVQQPAESFKGVLGRLFGGIQIKAYDPARKPKQTFGSIFHDLVVDAGIRRTLQGVAKSLVLRGRRG